MPDRAADALGHGLTMSQHAHPKPPADAAKATPPSAEPSAHDELTRLRQELQQTKDQYLRTLADVENTKKRFSREKEEFARYAAESMIRQLLPILDSLDQALVAVDKQSDPEAVVKGVHLIHRQLLGLLKDEGVVRIPTVGHLFDPHQHEAVAQAEATDGTKDNTITEEVQVGYQMHGRVIRPAMVKVAKTTGRTQHTTRSTQQKTEQQEQQ